MTRNISFMLTTEQVRNRTKTVTRRLGWYDLKAGTILNACEKCQGLKAGEKVKIICQIRVKLVRRQPLNWITVEDCRREGFPQMTPAQFVEFFCKHNKCGPHTVVTRIEFEYI